MNGLLDFDRLARARGDGLLPQLRQVLERRARLASSDGSVVELHPGDTGRNMAPAAPGFIRGNVAALEPRIEDAARTATRIVR